MFDVIFVGAASTVTSLIATFLGLGGSVTLLALLGQVYPLRAVKFESMRFLKLPTTICRAYLAVSN